MPPESYGATDTNYTPDSLFAGEHPIVTRGGTIASGQNVCSRGQVLGIITASGKYAKYNSGGADGTQNPVAILANDIDATSADQKITVYETGWFNKAKVIGFAENIRATLRGLGIHVSS